MAAALGGSLCQTFMPRRDYDAFRDDDREWHPRPRLPFSLALAGALIISAAVIISISVSLAIVFPGDSGLRPLCRDGRDFQALPLLLNVTTDESEPYHDAFYLTDAEMANYYWMVVFLPSAVVFLFSAVYLFAGVAVAYAAPRRHPCLKVVENNYCASKRGGVRCLSVINAVFAVIYGLMALFLGSTLLSLESSCSAPLFWCYEIASWGLVILYGGTAFFLRRNAVPILEGGDFAGRNLVEMSESVPKVTPEMERRVNEGFKSWMGSSFLSSDDEEDGPDDYLVEGHPILTNSIV